MEATISDMDASSEAFTLTLQGGVLTITFNGPSAGTIGTATDDTEFLNISMNSAADLEIRKLRWILCEDATGDGTFDAAADTDSGWSDLEDFKVVDTDTDEIVQGPQDGSAFTTSDTDTCPNSQTGAS